VKIEELQIDVGGEPLTYRLSKPDPAELAEVPWLLLTLFATRHDELGPKHRSVVANAFVRAGHYVASFDLPHHGERAGADGDGITAMRDAFFDGRDPFRQFVADGRAVIDDCEGQGVGIEGRVVASGVSRSGYCVLRLVAEEARIAGTAAMAPVTDWRVLREFEAVADRSAVAELALHGRAEALADRPLFIAIGDDDQRVSTDVCIGLADRINGVRTEECREPSVELQVVESEGHTLPAESYRAGARFLLDLCAGS
jgi:dienelactone hydrolase